MDANRRFNKRRGKINNNGVEKGRRTNGIEER